MLRFLLVCALFAALPIQAQTLAGRILGEDARPIPYANIGLKNRPVGTVSGRDGSFWLPIPDLGGRDTLRVSSIGYATQELPAAGHGTQQLEIRLREEPQQPPAPVITHLPRKRYTFGRSIASNRFSAAFRAGQQGGEMGVKCKLGNLRGELQRARLNLAGCKGVDTLHMRLNVYAMRGDRIRKNLLAEPVYFSVPASEADKTATIDLRPYNITVQGDFLISVENLTPLPAGAKYWIRARLLSRTYTRYTSQAPWKMRKAGVGLSVDVLVESE